MKILILGAGQVGSTAAQNLSREEANEITVVDQRGDVLRELQDRLDIRTVQGHASYPEVLERAGLRDAANRRIAGAIATFFAGRKLSRIGIDNDRLSGLLHQPANQAAHLCADA